MTNEGVGQTPPGPDGLPLVGNLVEYARDPFDFERRVHREYGDVVRWQVPGGWVYHLADPEHVEHVLVQNNQNYVKGEAFQQTLGPVTGNGLLNSEGEFWRRQRHLIEPAFHPDRISTYAEMMVAVTERRIEDWRDGDVRNVHAEMMELTLEIVGRTLFGLDLRDESERVGEALEVVMAASEFTLSDLIPRWVPTPENRRFERAVETLNQVVARIVRERRANPTDEDVVSKLLNASDEEGRSMSERQVHDEVMTLLLAGHETTALALTFTFFLLAQHARVEEKLLAELQKVAGDEPPTVEDLDDLTYLENTVKESMRFYPPVPGVVREPVSDDRVGDYRIPAGVTVSTSQHVIHRDPRWYDDPMAFRPERWSSEVRRASNASSAERSSADSRVARDEVPRTMRAGDAREQTARPRDDGEGSDPRADDFEQSLPRLAYFPFAAGPRRCIGDRFAMLEARLVLATILQNYHLELVSSPSLDLRPSITARPRNPVEMRVHDREGGVQKGKTRRVGRRRRTEY